MFKRILIVVDARPAGQSAVRTGVALAKVHGAQVHFQYVLPNYPVPMMDGPLWTTLSEEDFDREARAGAGRLLAAAAVVADKAGVAHRSAMERSMDDAKGIVEAAKKRRCDLIVVGSEGRNAVMRLMMGSVIPGLITAAPMPIMICKGTDKVAVRRKADVLPVRKTAARRRRAAAA